MLVGKVVKFSKDTSSSIGVVIDKISMINSQSQPIVVSGYLVQEVSTNKLHSIHHWRIQELIPSEEEIQAAKAKDDLKDPFNQIAAGGGKNVFEAMGIPAKNIHESNTDANLNEEDDDLPF